MSRALSYLGLAKKAGLLEIGEENTGAAIRWGKARFVILAADASDNARRRLEGFLYGKNIPMLRVSFTKDEISAETGKKRLLHGGLYGYRLCPQLCKGSLRRRRGLRRA